MSLTPLSQEPRTTSDKMRKGLLDLPLSLGTGALYTPVAACSEALQHSPAGKLHSGAVVGGLHCLLSARELLLRGWSRDGMAVDARGHEVFCTRHESRAVAWSLVGAISSARVENPIEREQAKKALRKLLKDHDLPSWNAHPLRTQDEVLSIIDRAIVSLGGVAPLTRPSRVRTHRGGWQVTAGVRSPAPRALIARREVSPPAPLPAERIAQLEREVEQLRAEAGERALAFNIQLSAALKRSIAQARELAAFKSWLSQRPRGAAASTTVDAAPPALDAGPPAPPSGGRRR